MKNIFYLFLSVSIVLISCKERKVKYSFTNSYEITENYLTIKLQADSLFSNQGEYLNIPQHFSKEIDSLFTIFLPSKKRLYLYNFPNQSLLKSVDFQGEGSAGIGHLTPDDLHYYISSDSIFIYNSSARKLYLSNENNGVYRKYDFNNFHINKPINTAPHLFSPLIKFNHYIFFINGITTYPKPFDRKQYPMIMRLDLNTGEITSGAPLPKIYEEGYWGATPLYMPFMDIDKANETLLVSYPVSPDVFVYGLDLTERDRWNASSPNISLKPFDETDNGYLYGKDYDFFAKANQKYREQSYYHAILTDPYKKLYYRVNKLALLSSISKCNF